MGLLVRRLGLVALILLVPFAIATALGGWEHAPALPGGVGLAMAVVIGLLAADVVLPVPSSAVLIASGAALGPVLGAVAGTLGVVAGATVGYVLGARVGREPSGPDAARARRLVARWGAAAIVLTRPVPLLAESTAIVAGTTRMPPGRFLAAVVAGALPTGVGLALAGHAGTSSLDPTSLGMVVAVTAALAVGAALVPRRDPRIRR